MSDNLLEIAYFSALSAAWFAMLLPTKRTSRWDELAAACLMFYRMIVLTIVLMIARKVFGYVG